MSERTVGKSGQKMEESATQPTSEILPESSSIPASSLEIGSWEKISLFPGDLEAKFMYSERVFQWEIVEGSLRFRIQIKFSDIVAIMAIIIDNLPGLLDIKMSRTPLFFQMPYTNTPNHTQWRQVQDFTGQAQACRWHHLKFPPGVLDVHYELLLKRDRWLRLLSRFPPSLSSEILPASIIPVSSLTIGSWKIISLFPGDLEATFMYSERLFLWEFVEGSLRNRIEIKFSDIVAIRAIIIDNQPGILDIQMSRPPLFFRTSYTNMPNRTLWQQVQDFTGQTQTCRWHRLKFPSGALDEHYELLLQRNKWLHLLSQIPISGAFEDAPMIPRGTKRSQTTDDNEVPAQQIQRRRNEMIIGDFPSRFPAEPVVDAAEPSGRGRRNEKITRDFLSRFPAEPVVHAAEPSGRGRRNEKITRDFLSRLENVNQAQPSGNVDQAQPSGNVGIVCWSEMATIDCPGSLVMEPIGPNIDFSQSAVEPGGSGAGARRIEMNNIDFRGGLVAMPVGSTVNRAQSVVGDVEPSGGGGGDNPIDIAPRDFHRRFAAYLRRMNFDGRGRR